MNPAPERELPDRRNGTATSNSQFITNILLAILALVMSITGAMAWSIKQSQDTKLDNVELKLTTLTALFGEYQVRQERRITLLEAKMGVIVSDAERLRAFNKGRDSK